MCEHPRLLSDLATQPNELAQSPTGLSAEQTAALQVYPPEHVIAVIGLFRRTRDEGLILTGELYSSKAIGGVIRNKAIRAADQGESELLPGAHGTILDIITGADVVALAG